MSVASDARVDSMGYVVGSFVGEGTSRAVHLLSSDTGFIAALARRYRPALERDGDLWRALARERVVSLAPAGRRRTTGTPMFDRALVGGPAGHTSVTPTAILLHGSACGPRGAQAEIIVEDDHRAQEPALRGPVLGSFTHSEPAGSAAGQPRIISPARTGSRAGDGPGGRAPRPNGSGDGLDARGAASFAEPAASGGSSAGDQYPRRISTRPTSSPSARPPSAVRYAVSLRARRITEEGTRCSRRP